MAKNLPPDHLDDYVRDSFDGYEENPSSDMWDRIDGALSDEQPEKKPVTPLTWLRLSHSAGWRLAAASVIFLLVSMLLLGRHYYERRIHDLEAAAVRNAVTSGSSPEISTAKTEITGSPSANNASNTVQQHYTEETSAIAINPTPVEKKKTGKSPEKAVSPADQYAATLKPARNTISQEKTVNNHQNRTSTDDVALQHSNNQATSTPINNNLEQPTPENIKTETIPALAFIRPEALEPVPYPVLTVSSMEEKSLATPATVPIQPVQSRIQTNSGWYFGLAVAPGITTEKAKAPPASSMRPRLTSTPERETYVLDYWLKAGKKAKNKLGFETGIGFRELDRTATHTPRFRFREGMSQPGNPGAQNYDFSYDLDSYGGSSEVTVRMSQVDTGVTIPDDTPLSLTITTRQKTQLLQIPLLARYDLGYKNWDFNVKAGLVGKYFLKNDLEIAAENSQGSPLQIRQGQSSQRLNVQRPGALFLGYQVSAGVEWRPSAKWGIALEPTFAADFERENTQGRKLPRQSAFTLNTGVNYYF
ncbi:MAG: hypothetical protein IT269_06350 [Saprospiraceae bacterium]|nr:hypothetical protein [Saprospiraceae bacterium]